MPSAGIAPWDHPGPPDLERAGTQDLADIEAIVESGADREAIRAAVRDAVPDRVEVLERLPSTVDRAR